MVLRRARRDRYLEMGDVPGLDRPLACRAATPADGEAASLPRRRPPLAPDLVAGAATRPVSRSGRPHACATPKPPGSASAEPAASS